MGNFDVTTCSKGPIWRVVVTIDTTNMVNQVDEACGTTGLILQVDVATNTIGLIWIREVQTSIEVEGFWCKTDVAT